jgi:Zn-dependent protease
MLTLFSLISPFKIIAPGAVMIGNIVNWDHYGQVAAAGPISNIGMGLLFFVMSLISGNPFVLTLAYLGMRINASLALFNLIPLGMFDGAKIIKWNKMVYTACVVAAGILYIFS